MVLYFVQHGLALLKDADPYRPLSVDGRKEETFVSYLITGNENAGAIEFTNGGIVWVKKDSIGFHVEWYLITSMCRA